MTIKKSKAMYLLVLLGCVSLAFADMQYNERKALVYQVQPSTEPEFMLTEAAPSFNQNKTDHEKNDTFYSMLLPCD